MKDKSTLRLISYNKQELTWLQKLAVKILEKFIFTEEQTKLRFKYTFSAGGYYGAAGVDLSHRVKINFFLLVRLLEE